MRLQKHNGTNICIFCNYKQNKKNNYNYFKKIVALNKILLYLYVLNKQSTLKRMKTLYFYFSKNNQYYAIQQRNTVSTARVAVIKHVEVNTKFSCGCSDLKVKTLIPAKSAIVTFI